MELHAGTRIAGRYEVLSPLGKGGLGQVVLCRDLLNQKRVAVKKLDTNNAQLPAHIAAQTRNEAGILSKLRHRNIVRVYDFIEDYTGSYFVLEFIDGTTLDDWLFNHPVSIRDFLKIAYQCLEGLGAAHRSGLLHLDLKPANIMAINTPIGLPDIKLVDFGLAEIITELVARGEEDDIMGSVYYIAPEQLTNEPLSPATDIYSLGLSLYHLLAGQAPFQGKTPNEICAARLSTEPAPLASINAACSPSLEAWIHGMIRRDPADRAQSCQEAINQLTHVAIDRRTSIREEATRRGRRQQIKNNFLINKMSLVTRWVAQGFRAEPKRPAPSDFFTLEGTSSRIIR